jgi:DNA-binding transcriptional regulator YhcF (GntR family)
MDIQVDFHIRIPLYEQIAHGILYLVEEGELMAGEQLPPVRELAAQLDVNFNTVARAYRLLDQQAVISTQHGRGTYILGKSGEAAGKNPPAENIEELTRYYIQKATYLGFQPQEIKKCFDKMLEEGEQT